MQNFSPEDCYHATVYDRDGGKVGKVEQVYLNDETGDPSWVTVQTGFFGTNESLVPLADARLNDDVLKVPFDKQTIKDAPNYDPGHHLDAAEERELYRYYGLDVGPDTIDPEPPPTSPEDPDTESDTDDHIVRERELLERERDLLERERDLLDRDRQLAEREGTVRPRLRRHLREHGGPGR